MIFTIDANVPESDSSGRSPISTVAEQLDREGVEYRPVGSTLELRGEWEPAMTALKRCYESLASQFPQAALTVTARDQTTEQSRRADEADRESFPASDPPGTNPGST